MLKSVWISMYFFIEDFLLQWFLSISQKRKILLYPFNIPMFVSNPMCSNKCKITTAVKHTTARIFNFRFINNEFIFIINFDTTVSYNQKPILESIISILGRCEWTKVIPANLPSGYYVGSNKKSKF